MKIEKRAFKAQFGGWVKDVDKGAEACIGLSYFFLSSFMSNAIRLIANKVGGKTNLSCSIPIKIRFQKEIIQQRSATNFKRP